MNIFIGKMLKRKLAEKKSEFDKPSPYMLETPHGCRFVPWMLHFSPSSLPGAWESRPGQPKAVGPCTSMVDPEEAPGIRLA